MKKSILFVLLSFFILESFRIQKEKELSLKDFLKSFSYVPSGSFVFEEQINSVQSFYISKTEISNKEYRLFLSDLILQGESEKLKIAMIDSAAWMIPAYAQYYHSHPAYDDYPVVNISHEGAGLYCEWLSEKIRKESGGKIDLIFRIPTRIEWVRAAQGNLMFAEYSWGHHRLRNSEGQLLCNFLTIDAENVARDTNGRFIINLDSYNGGYAGTDVTAPVKSYWPNNWGLYNMNGNVAEMVAEKGTVVGGSWRDPGYDVRNLSVKRMDKASPNIGFRVVATHLNSGKK